ncbi:MAG: glutamine amidotransferase [Candidatus Binatia bacterium]
MPFLPPFIFERQDFLYLLGLLPLFWVLQWRAFRGFFSFLGLLLHTLVASVLILALAGLATLKPGAETTPLLILDLSRSLTAEQRHWMQETITHTLQPAGDIPTVVFAGQQRLMTWQEAEPLLTNPSTDLQLDETNLEGAFTALLASMHNRSVYLISDGWETKADAQSLTPLLTEKGLKVYPFPPPPAAAAPNVAIQRLSVPQTMEGGEAISAAVALENTNRTAIQGALTVRQGEKVVWQQDVTLAPGASLLTRSLTLTGDGLIPLRATFTSNNKQEDSVAQDNQAAAWVTIAPREKVLLLSARARDNRYLEKALDNRGFNVVTADFASRPSAIPGAESFSAVILNNVAKDKLPPVLLNGLDDYVNRGGGLLMIGGEESLGLGGYNGSAIEKVLPVSLVPPQKPERHTAMVLVIDTSGSMRKENKLLYAKEGIRAVARNLKDADLLGIIGFDREPFVVISLEPLGKIRNDIDYRIGRLTASGGTFLLPALEEARRQLIRSTAARKQVVILTDGETGGSGSDYLDLVTVMHREAKITVSSIALGEEANLRLLSRISDYGGGAFHHTTNPSSLPELFLDEMDKEEEEKTMVEKDLVLLPNRDSPLLKGLNGQIPPIKGYVEAQLKHGARMDIALRVGGQRPPLLASWTYGRGKAVAFTSDANGRWSAPWISWEGFSKLWAQTVQWCLPEVKRQETHFSVELGHNAAGLVVDVFSYGASEEGRTASAKINGPGNNDGVLPLERLAPGHYQGMLANPKSGDYRVDVILPSGEKVGPLGYTVPPRQTGETPQPQPNFSLLEALAAATGGSVNPDVSTLIQPTSPSEHQPLLPYLIPLAMALYFLELIVRRLA